MDRVVFTPYFLGTPVAGLDSLSAPRWQRNAPFLPPGDAPQRMIVLFRALAEKVAAIVADGDRPVSFAGDCCSAIGVLAGLQRAGLDPTLVWLDAHGDFNTWETSPSGFLGGMPLAMLTGRGDQTMVEALDLRTLDDARVILSDARDLDPEERKSLQASRVKHVPDFGELLRGALPDGSLYLHLDVDVIDPEEAPGVDYPAPGGATARAVGTFLERLVSEERLAAVSVSAWNPEKDEEGRTERAIMNLLRPLMAGRAS